MALPNSIQQQADYADAIEQSMQGGVTEGAEQENTQTQPVTDMDETEKLRNRYASLQGKYNAEVPRLHSNIKDLETRYQQLMEENEALRSEIANTEANQSYLTEQDAEAYGEDMVDLVRRGAREEAARYASEAAMMKAQIQELQAQVQASSHKADQIREESFYSTLTKECPQWEAQNSDPGFLAWLEESDPVYGFQRNEALQRAFNSLDPYAVAQIFNQYQHLRNAPLARQVSPNVSRGASAGAPVSEQIWTNDLIAQFYEAWRRHQIPEDQAVAIEKEINAAVAQGRVQ